MLEVAAAILLLPCAVALIPVLALEIMEAASALH